MGRVLIIDDDRAMCETIEARLRRRGHDVWWCAQPEESLSLLDQHDAEVVVTDLNMKHMSGIELCERITANRPDVPVVVITAFGSMENAIAAIRVGAYDFLNKPFEIEALDLAIGRAVQSRDLREEVKRLRAAVAEAEGFGELVGTSSEMRRLYHLLSRICESESSVLVRGETGTGKELIARAIHERSRRAGGPFVALNCAAMPHALLESELFGHVRGAFTSAEGSRKGLLLASSGGTLFLDEIAELPLDLQPKLLRALQERTVRPVGGEGEVAFDARIVSATNRDLEQEVAEGRFREDLFYRLEVLTVHAPPLRSRGADALLLAQQFLDRLAARAGKRIKGFVPAAAERLLAYAWPGNVRELQNCIERAVALATHEKIQVEDLPERIRSYRCGDLVIPAEDPGELLPLAAVERAYILRVLEATGGNKTLAARTLGLDRKTLYRKLDSYP